jgi:hypothetical protein
VKKRVFGQKKWPRGQKWPEKWPRKLFFFGIKMAKNGHFGLFLAVFRLKLVIF